MYRISSQLFLKYQLFSKSASNSNNLSNNNLPDNLNLNLRLNNNHNLAAKTFLLTKLHDRCIVQINTCRSV